MLVGHLEYFAKRSKAGGGCRYRTQRGQRTGFAHIIEQLVHVLEFFRSMFTQEGGAASIALMVAPGAHLQIEVRRVLFKADLLVQSIGHGVAEHVFLRQYGDGA